MSTLRVTGLLLDAAGTGATDFFDQWSDKVLINYQTLTANQINYSKNVSSFTDGAVGLDIINFTNFFNGTFYNAAGTAQKGDGTDDANVHLQCGGTTSTFKSSTFDRIRTRSRTAASDYALIQYSAEGVLA